ncbi:MAG: alpha/beta fold hydrolase [Anaerolineae bacterium]|nr:alpha/beta fold hydrolase [Anaerolineae bacterium]
MITFEDYDDPNSGTIRTAVIIIHSRSANPSKEAMLFTEGGPGYSALASVWWLAGTDFANHRDIVILEQRGNKHSDPSLTCDFSVWWDEKEGDTPCLDSLRQRGIALENYTAESIAADINALKQVLDYERWILYGTSYSTRLMQLVMVRYPEKIRGVVLHSTSPIADTRYLHDTEHSARVLRVMFDDCAANLACAEAYPDLENQFYELVHKLNDEPVAVEMTFPGSTERSILEVNGDTLISWMVEDAFYGPAYPPFETAYLPLLIDELSQGNMDLLYPWAKAYVSRWGNDAFAWGLYFAINCQDDAASVKPEMIEAQIAAYPELGGYYRHRTELEICSVWGLDPAPPLATEAIASDIPALILAGTYDPITPPEWSRTATVNLSNSTFVEFPASGHSVVRDNPCAQQITAAFLDDPNTKPDLRCVGDAPEPEFMLLNEIIIAPAMYEIHYGELGYSMLEENLFLGSWLTLIGTGVVGLIAGLVKLVQRYKQSSSGVFVRIAHPLLIVLPATALVWGYALRFSLQSVAATTPNVLRFGLPVACWWIFAVAILIGLMMIVLIATAILAWKHRYWSLIGRFAISLTALAAVIFCGMLAHWSLFAALLLRIK